MPHLFGTHHVVEDEDQGTPSPKTWHEDGRGKGVAMDAAARAGRGVERYTWMDAKETDASMEETDVLAWKKSMHPTYDGHERTPTTHVTTHQRRQATKEVRREEEWNGVFGRALRASWDLRHASSSGTRRRRALGDAIRRCRSHGTGGTCAGHARRTTCLRGVDADVRTVAMRRGFLNGLQVALGTAATTTQLARVDVRCKTCAAHALVRGLVLRRKVHEHQRLPISTQTR